MKINGIEIQGVTSNSKKVKEGYIFVAIKGEEFDGNAYIDEAISKGAVMIYTAENFFCEGIPVIKVEDARKALASLCNTFYDYPSKKLKIIGVTGTNGKTTTTQLIYKMLRNQGISAGLVGSLDIRINDEVYQCQYTTPIAEEIYYYLAKMVDKEVEILVMEVSSHGLKNRRVYGIEFDIALHTNIDRDHMNFHKTLEDYINTKKLLFDGLKKGTYAVINFDDEHGLKLLEGNKDIFVISYGLNSKSTITASSIDYFNVTSFNYCLQRGITTLSGKEIDLFEYPVVLPLLGKHNVYNGLAAITCGLLLDIPIASIAQALKDCRPITRRLETIYDKDFKIIDDYSHNPASYEAALTSVQSLEYNNLYIVNAIRGNRGIEINKENAEVLRQWCKLLGVEKVLITSSKDHSTSKDQVTDEERNAYLNIFSNTSLPYDYEETLKEAIEKTVNLLKEGDLLLLLGAQGMDGGREFAMDIVAKRERHLIINH
ncbi:Mur ligase family protein [Alkaliphilus serpentinus]|uniref:UDP-N-acetylmuramyl-tripeptide synthetase n=1 Tax=Alkaliphilus serpentinus TaxID=1482731 RepID=A0A833HPI5_9FIRM|nr:UDP-N-acetylmuramyl-tripeptide synthetase [Alkaliphilus serpentinus]KAB3529836.1 UDP-N-acetylmuramyl-tripeptide synthetase [Alkaliphilus serpentinus]